VDHLSHVDIQEISSFSGWIVEDPIEQEKYVRYTFRIDSVLLGDLSIKMEGKIQLHVRKKYTIRSGLMVLISMYLEVYSPSNSLKILWLLIMLNT
jgi:hypothetical protein